MKSHFLCFYYQFFCRRADGFAPHPGTLPWPRIPDAPIQHCFPLQSTLPPSHPTLPRSYHQAVAVTSSRSAMMPDSGLDAKAAVGGPGGMVGTGVGGVGGGGSGGGGGGGHKRKRSWSRAVFTSLQRKGLEKRFELQKYVNKPERRQLASALGLSDAQVKVWFQNRRMKWRHTQQFKRLQQHGDQHEAKDGRGDQHHVHTDSDDSSNNGLARTDDTLVCETRYCTPAPVSLIDNNNIDIRDDEKNTSANVGGVN
ncbi:uncharacterized protein [Diadema setosum]|uniref:uncharacterized protein n=1 Tax=Diadema setosum TaxID=31175 RepID=UPI003B3AA979